MRLFDTLTQEKRTLDPLGEAVTLYVCGITPYDTTHLGHAWLNVVFDTLVRALRWEGRRVVYVQNVTDIDDDILRKARELGLAWDELGRRETQRYLKDLAALNCLMPDHYVAASAEIPRILKLVEALLANGHAYVRDGWVYYRVAADPGYGQLAAAGGYVGYDNLLRTANERGNTPDDPRKDDPLDFVLWQARQSGEPGWPSPWGEGRPGWHIECSAMATGYLGPRIDIHGGGADLIFPHHTSEIAQSENATGEHPFVRIWMHLAMLQQDGEKMSKSLGNLTRVGDLLPTYAGEAIRLLLLAHHYREPWEYHPADMDAAAERWELLRRAGVAAPGAAPADALEGVPAAADAGAPEGEAACGARAEVRAALDDDLDTPRALRAVEALARDVLDGGAPGGASALAELAGVLGLRPPAPGTGAPDADVSLAGELPAH
jgi:L-cysteine:1D-myo-inositol 2-amino-2-deoxy-alpha-D-glucopyranoside ligase